MFKKHRHVWDYIRIHLKKNKPNLIATENFFSFKFEKLPNDDKNLLQSKSFFCSFECEKSLFFHKYVVFKNSFIVNTETVFCPFVNKILHYKVMKF